MYYAVNLHKVILSVLRKYTMNDIDFFFYKLYPGLHFFCLFTSHASIDLVASHITYDSCFSIL